MTLLINNPTTPHTSSLACCPTLLYIPAPSTAPDAPTGTLGGRGEYFQAAVAVGGLKGVGRKDGAEKVGGMEGGFFLSPPMQTR